MCILSRKLSIFFSLGSGLIYIKGHLGFFVIKMRFPFFFKNENNNSFSILFVHYFSYKNLCKTFTNFYIKFFSYYHFRLKLKGLGFRVVRMGKNLYKFFFTQINFIYVHVPSCVILRTKGRRLIFFSAHYNILRLLIVNMLLLKNLVIYKLRGLFYPRQIIIMKPGKKRF